MAKSLCEHRAVSNEHGQLAHARHSAMCPRTSKCVLTAPLFLTLGLGLVSKRRDDECGSNGDVSTTNAQAHKGSTLHGSGVTMIKQCMAFDSSKPPAASGLAGMTRRISRTA